MAKKGVLKPYKLGDKWIHNFNLQESEIPNDKLQKVKRDGKKAGRKKSPDMDEFKQITGDFITGLDFIDPDLVDLANAEVESGEYIKDVDTGRSKQVVGRRHSQGGEMMFLKEGDKVLSDHTKLGGPLATKLRKNFDMPVKAKNTFSDVLDKYKKKSGLEKLIAEEESLLKKLKEEQEREVFSTADKQTKKINNNFLINTLQDIREKKKPLQEGLDKMFDLLFKEQESRKKPSEAYMQEGGLKMRPQLDPDYIGAQPRNEAGIYGDTNVSMLFDFMLENQWFDFSNFNPTNPQDVLNFQKQFNQRNPGNVRLREDGKLGEQTIRARMSIDPMTAGIAQGDAEITGGPLISESDVPTVTPPINPIPETTPDPSGGQAGVAGMPNVPYQQLIGQLLTTTNRDLTIPEYDPRLLELNPYIQSGQNQRELTRRSVEGLSPEMQAAVLANADANISDSIRRTATQIDSNNVQMLNNAELQNIANDTREQQVNNRYDSQFETQNIQALENQLQEIVNNMDENQRRQLEALRFFNNMGLINRMTPNVGDRIQLNNPDNRLALMQQLLAQNNQG